MPTADQIVQNWQSPKWWFYAGAVVFALFLVRQFWRATDKLWDSAFAKVSKRIREIREKQKQEREQTIVELRSDPEARQLWLFREMRLRVRLVAKMITGGVLVLLGPASAFMLVIGFATKPASILHAVFFVLGGATSTGCLLLLDAWIEWWMNANEMRDMLNEAMRKKSKPSAETPR